MDMVDRWIREKVDISKLNHANKQGHRSLNSYLCAVSVRRGRGEMERCAIVQNARIDQGSIPWLTCQQCSRHGIIGEARTDMSLHLLASSTYSHLGGQGVQKRYTRSKILNDPR